jgi:hypothetical protein
MIYESFRLLVVRLCSNSRLIKQRFDTRLLAHILPQELDIINSTAVNQDF